MVIRKAYFRTEHGLLIWHACTQYQLSYGGELEEGFFYGIYEVTVTKVENKMCTAKEQ
jgi:hypothetical protein